MKKIKLAISTCPNDTFAFHAILNKRIDLQDLDFDIELLDIQQLNDGLFAGRFDVAKASFHAAAILADQVFVLPSGSALGFGVGPLLLASHSNTDPTMDSGRGPTLTLCPGELTTATLLFKLFYADALRDNKTTLKQRVFSDIMPQLKEKQADFGVCIHEGRFTWKQEELSLVEDLGKRWESETQTPLPLGGIVARRDLSKELIFLVQQTIRDSIQYGLSNREETLPTMRQYAQEFDDKVLMQHVDLYVNQWTIDLGDVGRKSLELLSSKASECGVIENASQGLEIWQDDTVRH